MVEESRENTASDETLVHLACKGDAVAFERLVRRYEHPLFNFIRRMIGNATEAEDLFQETFLRVYKHLDRFRQTERFRPWLYRIAVNLCKDHMKWRRLRRHPSLDAGTGGDAHGVLGNRLAAHQPGPGALAEEAEAAARLAAAVARLSVKHRAVFLMARYEGMEYKEIARALAIPVGTVKSRMNKAVGLLMAKLKETEQ